MKSFLIVLFVCVVSAQCRLLRMPDYLRKFSCKKSDPQYEKCVLDGLLAAQPFFLKGIKELGVPPIDPLTITSFAVNRTLNEFISLNAVCTNVQVSGLKNTIINSLKADPINHYGELRATIPWAYLEMDYDIKGQLFVIPLENKGHFVGNFTNTDMIIKLTLKTFTKDGVEYFKVNKLSEKIRVGDGKIKLASKDKEFQNSADLITDFYNENARRVMDAVNPIFIEFSNSFAREQIDNILGMLPASEWVPE